MLNKTKQMLADFKAGLSCVQVGVKYSCSRQAVHQRLRYHGVDIHMGGIAISGPKRAAARRIIEILFSHIRVEKRMLKNYGCMTAEYNKYVSGMVDKDIKAAAYRQQARNAKTRGIAFNLTFPAWDKIWEASGHYANRGTKSGQYVMSRYGDKGPYAIGNVEVKTASENHSENRYK